MSLPPPLTQILFSCYIGLCSPFGGLSLCHAVSTRIFPDNFGVPSSKGVNLYLIIFRLGTEAGLKAQVLFFAPFAAGWGQVRLEAMARVTVCREL